MYSNNPRVARRQRAAKLLQAAVAAAPGLMALMPGPKPSLGKARETFKKVMSAVSKKRQQNQIIGRTAPSAPTRQNIVLSGQPYASKNSVVTASEVLSTVNWWPANLASGLWTLQQPGAYDCVPINPIYWPTTRAASVIRSYQRWRVRSCAVEFVPLLGTGWSGMVHTACLTEDTKLLAWGDPTQLASAMSTMPGYVSFPIQSIGLKSSNRSMTVRNVPFNSTCKPDEHCPMMMVVVTDLTGPSSTPTTATAVGKLMIHYTVEACDPTVPWTLVSGVTDLNYVRGKTGVNNLFMDAPSLTALESTSSVQPEHLRVCRAWSAAAATLGVAPPALSFFQFGSSLASTSRNQGGWGPTIGQHLSACCLRSTSDVIQYELPLVDHEVYYQTVKIADVETGLDISGVLTDLYFGKRPPHSGCFAVLTAYYANVLPAYKVMPGDIEGDPVTSASTLAMSFGLRALPAASEPEEESSDAPVALTTTTTTPEPVLAPAARFLPPIRKN